MNNIFAWLAAGLLAGASAPVWADDAEHREHGAHVHGVANLDLAVDGHELVAALTAPAMNIVGFEHPPRDDAQHRAVEEAAAWLEDGAQWLIPSEPGACRLETARVASGLLDTADGDGHDHDSHDDVHAEFHVHLAFHCANPGELRTVVIRLFERFPGMERIQLQAITEARQIGGALTAGDAMIKLVE